MKDTIKKRGSMDVIEKLYREMPAFTDVFTEETFYIFVGCFVATTLVLVFIASRFVKIKPIE